MISEGPGQWIPEVWLAGKVVRDRNDELGLVSFRAGVGGKLSLTASRRLCREAARTMAFGCEAGKGESMMDIYTLCPVSS